jgi:hypothetical protein
MSDGVSLDVTNFIVLLLLVLQPKKIKDIKEFLEKARRKDATGPFCPHASAPHTLCVLVRHVAKMHSQFSGKKAGVSEQRTCVNYHDSERNALDSLSFVV